MSSQDQDSFIDTIDESKPFSENWSAIRDLTSLFLPVGWEAERAVEDGDAEGLRDFIDRPGVEAQPGYRVQLVYTDPSRADKNTIVMGDTAFSVLHRTFRANACSGVLFNHRDTPPDAGSAQHQAYTMHSWTIPRLLGLLKTDSPELAWEEHLAKATSAFENNDIYSCFYHIAEARESGGAIHRCFLLEFEALLTLGCYQQAESFLDWFRPQCKRREMLEIPRARLLTISGHPKEALTLLKPLLVKSGKDPILWLERGRAFYRENRVSEAITSFEQCLKRDPQNIDAMLGLGIAIRGMHYESSNREGLEEAASWLTKVLENGDYFRAESAHHLGTIHLALEEYEKAEQSFQQALELAPSTVSRRNLALVRHALDRKDEGIQQARYLKTYFPQEAAGLERYYPDLSGGTTYVVTSDGASGSSTLTVSNSQNSAYVSSETSGSSSAATSSDAVPTTLKKLGLCFQGDLMDFRRFDDYVNYYAPCGTFLPSSAFAALNMQEFNQRLIECAQHFASVLHRGRHARPGKEGAQVEFLEGPSSGSTLDLSASLLRRIDAGSASDNMTSLEFLVLGLAPYSAQRQDYKNPFVTFEMEEERIAALKARARRARDMMESLGLPLSGNSNDLRQMDLAINSFFDEASEIRKAVIEKRFSDSSIEDLGIYLGFLVQKLAGGQWYEHPDVQGLALRGLGIQDIYPVARVTQLFLAGRPSGAIDCLTGLEAPLAMANLCKQVQKHEITTRAQLREALAEAIPSLMLDDPTGAAVNRMTEVVMAMSNTPLPG